MRFSHGHAGNARRAFRRACKCLAGKEAPKLGAGVGQLGSYRAVGQARKRAGFGAGMRPALLQVARRGCSRSGSLRVSAGGHAGRMVCKGWFGRIAAVYFSRFQFSGSLPLGALCCFPVSACSEMSRCGFQVACNFSAVCRPCVSAYILCKRVKEKMGVYMAYIYRTSEIEVTRRPKMA